MKQEESLGKMETSDVFCRKCSGCRRGGVDPILLLGACEGKAVPQQCHLFLRNNTVVIKCLGN